MNRLALLILWFVFPVATASGTGSPVGQSATFIVRISRTLRTLSIQLTSRRITEFLMKRCVLFVSYFLCFRQLSFARLLTFAAGSALCDPWYHIERFVNADGTLRP